MLENIPVQKNSQIPRPTLILVALLIIIVLLGLLYLKMSGSKETPPTRTAAEVVPLVSSTTNSLGGQIYEKAQNPLDGKLETQTPVANPINDAYKNPFE